MSSNFPITNDNTIDEEEKWRTGGGGGAGSDAGGGACGGADRLPVAGEGRGRRRGRRRRHRRRRRQVVVGHGPRAAASAWPKKNNKTKHSQHSIPFPVQSRVRMVHSILGRDHNIGDVLEHPSPSIVGRSCSSKPISTNCSGHFRRFFSTAGLVYETCAELWNLT